MFDKWKSFEKILEDQCVIGFVQRNGSHEHFLPLKEDDPQSTLPTIEIGGLPDKSILIKTDFVFTIPCFLKKEISVGERKYDLRQRCDYILFSCINGVSTIVFFELKSGNPKRSHIENQFLGAKCFLGYLDKVLQNFLSINIESCDSNQVVKRFVVIYSPDKIQKALKNLDPPRQTHNNPKNYYLCPVPKRTNLNSITIINYTALFQL